MFVPKKVCERFASGLKRMLPIVQQQRARDVSEADTVTLVKDILADVFGYDKYAELTGELAIRGTYCDLAIKLEDKIVMLVEIKAIGLSLDDRHVKQAVDYAANQGIEWVVLTNAATWRLYHVLFEKPIDKQLVIDLDLTTADTRDEEHVQLLFTLSKEGYEKGAHLELRDRQDALDRFLIAALLLEHKSVVSALRRELRRMVEVNVDEEEIVKVLRDAVIKREALESPAADAAAAKVRRAQAKLLRGQQEKVKGVLPESVDLPAPVPHVQVMVSPAVAEHSAAATKAVP